MVKKVTKKVTKKVEIELPVVEDEKSYTEEQKMNFILSFVHENKRALIEKLFEGVDTAELEAEFGRLRVQEFQKLLNNFYLMPHKWNYSRNTRCVSCEG